MADVLPSDEELRACVAVLRKLSPPDLSCSNEALEELTVVGVALFGSRALEKRFGQRDVVDFLAEVHNHKSRLKKLEKLEAEIKKAHDKRYRDVKTCGINAEREERSLRQAAGGDQNLHHVITAAEWEASKFVPRWAPRGPGDGTQGRGGYCVPPPQFRGIWREHEQEADDAGGEETCEDKENLSGTVDTSTIGKAASQIPKGDFTRRCLVCKSTVTDVHNFYHRMCAQCGDYNHSKRLQTGNLDGYVCVVTGGRVRIGYEIVLKLLRAGARVLATTRFPHDAASRFSCEADFETWQTRLELVGLELTDLRSVEAFCEHLAGRFQRIHILINNAAQTITRPTDWTERMADLEGNASQRLSKSARSLLWNGHCKLTDSDCHNGLAEVRPSTSSSPIFQLTDSDGVDPSAVVGHKDGVANEDLQLLSKSLLDESAQPLDLSRENSWSNRLGDVPTTELLRTLAANAAAPFVLCGKLRPLIAPDKSDTSAKWGHIINVSALEGQFSVGRKSSGHPHTNMAKAALNMLTATCAADLFKERVLVNAVDTGWVTDMAPGQKGFMQATHKTHVGPPLDENDGASRVLDPIFLHVNTGWKEHGLFWKHYRVGSW